MKKKAKITIQTTNNIEIARHVRQILSLLGENVERDGLKETPLRVTKMYQEIFSGYNIDPKSVFKTFNSDGYEGVVMVSDIGFHSMCEHHMAPFFGKVHIGYMPNGKIMGLSKFARLVEIFSRRLQVQERITKQIADSIMENLHPLGVIVYIEAEHMCMTMRGVKKNGTVTKTMKMFGVFKKDHYLTDQFIRQINSNLREN